MVLEIIFLVKCLFSVGFLPFLYPGIHTQVNKFCANILISKIFNTKSERTF